MAASDLQLNAAVRSVVASQWIDLQRIRFATFRGTVRFYGELRYLGAHTGNRSEAFRIENLEEKLRRLKGVRKVYFDLQNWRKNASGKWECLDEAVEQACPELENTGKQFELTRTDKKTS